jgi:hypothetical protein
VALRAEPESGIRAARLALFITRPIAAAAVMAHRRSGSGRSDQPQRRHDDRAARAGRARRGLQAAAPACQAGVTCDGTVDGTDFIAFINSFGIGDPADVAGAGASSNSPGGAIDRSELIAFTKAFAIGC